jgi:ABC-type dipeptide/oligopeptide/nickel transport system permease subunit
MSLADRFIPRRRRSIAEQSREDYYTASQGQLVWQRFKSNRTARIAFYVLVFFIFCGLFAPFLSPYDPTIAGPERRLHQRRAADPAVLRRERLLAHALHLRASSASAR